MSVTYLSAMQNLWVDAQCNSWPSGSSFISVLPRQLIWRDQGKQSDLDAFGDVIVTFQSEDDDYSLVMDNEDLGEEVQYTNKEINGPYHLVDEQVSSRLMDKKHVLVNSLLLEMYMVGFVMETLTIR